MTDAIVCAIRESASEHIMQCMEVWGGNQSIDNTVTVAGLDAWVFSRPYGDASNGGDVHYLSSCASGRITRLLVADVTGHGAAVHELAVGLRTLMRKFVNYIDQSRFVQAMNAKFSALSENGNFATAVVATFFAPTRRLSLCNAGHPPPLLYRAATGRWEQLDHRGITNCPTPANLPLGILDLSDYDLFSIDLQVGDLVLCYTDSLPESFAADGTMLCQSGLLDVVSTLDPADPPTLIPRLVKTITDLRDGNLRNDDVTVMLFRPNGSATQAPLKERLMAPLRIAKAVIQSLCGREEYASWPEMSVANIGGAVVGPLSKSGSRPTTPRPEHDDARLP